MKVCFVSHSPSTKGGAEKALLELIDTLKKWGIECHVFLPCCGPLAEQLRKLGATCSTLPYKWWMGKNSPTWKRLARIALNLALMIPLAMRIKRERCDVVYTNTITVCVGALAAKLLRLPHVWHIHEFGYEDHGLTFDLGPKISLWLMDRLSTVCIANSYAVAEKYSRYIDPSKMKVIYQAVKISQDVPIEKIEVDTAPGKEIKCVIVGSLQEGKRQEDAVKAMAELKKAGIKAKLFIVGDGDPNYREYLRNLVVTNNLDDMVTFVEYTENPFPFMQSANVALMCSKHEAFGRVTIEAMKLGKPVVGARSGGTVELIQDGFNGLLYTPGDYKELADKIKYLHDHPDIAQQMGRNAQKWAKERFNQDRYGTEVLTILRQFAKQRK